nr:uncharacterized protein LOC129280827 [Lytechinus pictus]
MSQHKSKRARKDENNGSNEFFPGINQIKYKPDAKPTDLLCYKHYNADEEVLGKSMAEWLRFSVCYWHTFRGVGLDPFGGPTISRHWDDGSESLENAKRRLRVAFEFFTKLGIRYWSFHDRDIAPEGATIEESNHNLDEIVNLALELQNKTGVKLLWNTCNLFSHKRHLSRKLESPQ